MKYIDYKQMKEFYTIEEVCRLFEMEKRDLQQYAEKYEVQPMEDQFDNWGFRKVQVRKLHNFIYKEQRGNSQGGSLHSYERRRSPWA